MALEWNQARFTTGFDEVDSQHKALFKGLNDFIEAITKSGSSGSKEAQESAINMLNFLGKYVIDHFKSEEEYMERYSCPMKEKNKAEHKKFIQQFTAIKTRIEEKGLTRGLVIKLEGFLCGWLINHIETVDKALYDVRPQPEQTVETKPKSLFVRLWRAVFA